jgi:hypothetical protein
MKLVKFNLADWIFRSRFKKTCEKSNNLFV